MPGKPRVVSVSDKPKKPRVVGEVDYTGLIEKEPEAGGQAKPGGHVLFRGLEKEEPIESADAVRDELRKAALADIKPLSRGEVLQAAHADQDRRGGFGRRIKSFFGLE
ncbi:MAG: hypothetical protein V1708_00665 [Candidatus Micrarchaeota archaeon]